MESESPQCCKNYMQRGFYLRCCEAFRDGDQKQTTREDFVNEFTAMYNKIDTNDEGDISMRNVITHIQAVEAGSGQNTWVNNRLDDLMAEAERRDLAHVKLEEFLDIIADIREAGWAVHKVRENERISDMDLLHVFEKVDRNRDMVVNRMELRLACKLLCKQFDIDIKREQELFKYMLESDDDNSGTLDFEEFKDAIKVAQKKLKSKELEEGD